MANPQDRHLGIALCVEGKTDIAVYSTLIRRMSPNFSIDLETRYFRGYSRMLHSLEHVLSELRDSNIDIFVVLADNDRNPTNKRYQAIQIICQNEAMDAAIGIAVEAMEAWLLADEGGLSFVKGSTVNRLPSPERIRHPDRKILEILSYRKRNISLSDALKAVIANSSLDILGSRCRSFRRFNSEYKRRLP